VSFPALIDQDSFVDHATELQVETRKLATIASQKLASLTELKQSLLHKAFAGELT
jgi:type I restriction enzyme S subunit